MPPEDATQNQWPGDIPAIVEQPDFTGQEVRDSNEADQIVESERAGSLDSAIGLPAVLRRLGETYRSDPMVAVRGQAFIKLLHSYIGSQLEACDV